MKIMKIQEKLKTLVNITMESKTIVLTKENKFEEFDYNTEDRDFFKNAI